MLSSKMKDGRTVLPAESAVLGAGVAAIERALLASLSVVFGQHV
jgi:hypothetical protein